MPTYPNILNLDKLNMSNSPIGDVDLGKYFNIEFPGYTTSPNTTPILSRFRLAATKSSLVNLGEAISFPLNIKLYYIHFLLQWVLKHPCNL